MIDQLSEETTHISIVVMVLDMIEVYLYLK